MAVTKILTIKSASHLKGATDYAMNEAKTVEIDYAKILTDYASNPEKTTDGVKYVSGINCFPETAAKKMAETKIMYDKRGGRIAYHVIQSFAPGELNTETAHEIGVEYAKKLFGDYEVVIGTHLDRQHLHNHIVANSVSCVTGKKFHMNKNEFYEKIYGYSNELCKKHGLSIVEEDLNVARQKAAWEKSPAKRDMAIQAINDSLEGAVSAMHFFILLKEQGYDVVTSGKYPKLKRVEDRKYMRFATLGFDMGALHEYFTSLPQAKRTPAKKLIPTRYYRALRPKRKLTYFGALYIHYLFILGAIKNTPKKTWVPPEEYRKFNIYKKMVRFITQNDISNTSDALRFRGMLQAEIAPLQGRLSTICKQKQSRRRLFKEYDIYASYHLISGQITGDQKTAYLRACEYIEKKSYIGQPDMIGKDRKQLNVEAKMLRVEIRELNKKISTVNEILNTRQNVRAAVGRDDEARIKSLPRTVEPEIPQIAVSDKNEHTTPLSRAVEPPKDAEPKVQKTPQPMSRDAHARKQDDRPSVLAKLEELSRSAEVIPTKKDRHRSGWER